MDFSKIVASLGQWRAGHLLIGIGAIMILGSLVSAAFGVELIEDEVLRAKVFETGQIIIALGAFLSWVRADKDSRSSRQQSMDSTLAALVEKINKVYQEVIPNGGGSLRDSINRVERMALTMNQRQLALVSDSEKPVFETDAEGDCIWVNPAYCMFLDRQSSFFYGKGWVNGVTPEDRDAVFSEWVAAVNQKRDFEDHVAYLDSKGRRKIGLVKGYRLRDEADNSLGYIGVITPVEGENG